MGFTIARIIAAILLFLALDRHPYGYYKLLRFVVCGVTAYGAYFAASIEKVVWVWIFGIIAVLFNPFIPIRLDRDFWAFFDIAVAIILFASLFLLREPKSQKIEHREMVDEVTENFKQREKKLNESVAGILDSKNSETEEISIDKRLKGIQEVNVSCSKCGRDYTVTLTRYENQAICPFCSQLDNVDIEW